MANYKPKTGFHTMPKEEHLKLAARGGRGGDSRKLKPKRKPKLNRWPDPCNGGGGG